MITKSKFETADSNFYWQGAREGKLLLQKCRECGQVQFPPRWGCGTCWSDLIDVVEASGRGVLESTTIVRRASMPAFQADVPYVVAAVALEEGPRMITNIVGDKAFDASAGDAVRVVFVAAYDGDVLPQFTLD